LDNDASDKLGILYRKLGAYDGLCVCYSGGADSAFLAKAARDVLNGRAAAVLVDGAMLDRRDYNNALETAELIGIKTHVIGMDPFETPEFRVNGRMRCYHCKKAMLGRAVDFARALGIAHVADGSNADDLRARRPGLAASAELGVVSPLAEAGMTKADIRGFSRALGLPTWDKPANSCLATRFPYGTVLTPGQLARAEAAENALGALGVTGGRVRIHGDIARVEVAPADFGAVIRSGLARDIRGLGFRYVTLDLEGFRSGSMD